MIQAIRVSDGHDPFADRKNVGITELHCREAGGCGYPDEGDIRVGVPSDNLGVIFLAVFQAHLNVIGSFDNVIIGDDIAFLINDETGAEALLLEIFLGIGAKMLFEKIKWVFFSVRLRAEMAEGVPTVPGAFFRPDIDNGRADHPDDFTEAYGGAFVAGMCGAVVGIMGRKENYPRE